jgi:hypothetical protein
VESAPNDGQRADEGNRHQAAGADDAAELAHDRRLPSPSPGPSAGLMEGDLVYEDAPPHGAGFEFVVPQTGTSAADN